MRKSPLVWDYFFNPVLAPESHLNEHQKSLATIKEAVQFAVCWCCIHHPIDPCIQTEAYHLPLLTFPYFTPLLVHLLSKRRSFHLIFTSWWVTLRPDVIVRASESRETGSLTLHERLPCKNCTWDLPASVYLQTHVNYVDWGGVRALRHSLCCWKWSWTVDVKIKKSWTLKGFLMKMKGMKRKVLWPRTLFCFSFVPILFLCTWEINSFICLSLTWCPLIITPIRNDLEIRVASLLLLLNWCLLLWTVCTTQHMGYNSEIWITWKLHMCVPVHGNEIWFTLITLCCKKRRKKTFHWCMRAQDWQKRVKQRKGDSWGSKRAYPPLHTPSIFIDALV